VLDPFGRTIDYLRISVTDRCNLRCIYCMPPEGVELLPHSEILSLEEMAEVAEVGAELGIRKVKLTGGEPLLRKNLAYLVERIAAIDAIKDFGITTNGTLFADHARTLRAAGLGRVNISLDTLDPARYARITRGGNLEDVFRGIEAALETGFEEVKLNAVLLEDTTSEERAGLTRYATELGLDIRFIPQMDLARGQHGAVHGGAGGQCEICNRVRLTSYGTLRPCLFSDFEVSVRELGPKAAFELAVAGKPEVGDQPALRPMHQIGG
jgi:cyclic pyranopterin phosphate synthase